MVTRQTSLLAFENLRPVLGQRHELILDALRSIQPATAYEVARFMGFTDPNAVRPRLNELFNHGLVEEAEARACRVTGKRAIAWRTVE